MIGAFGVLGVASVGIDAAALFGSARLSVARATGAAAAMLAGIFIMRFAFYMMHMTVGLGV